jgi:hypothetical protein
VQISDTRNSIPTRIFDYFWYQKHAQRLTEESLVSRGKDFWMAQRRRSDRSSHIVPSHHLTQSKVSVRLCDVLILKERFSWRAEEIHREIIRPQNPQCCPSQNKAAQRDLTTKTALKSGLRKTQHFTK